MHESVREMPSFNTKKMVHTKLNTLIYTSLHIKVDVGVFVSLGKKKSASPKLLNMTVLNTRDGCKNDILAC